MGSVFTKHQKNIMNRVSFVLNIDHNKTGDLYAHFRNAFLACLSPEENCVALDLGFDQSAELRQSIPAHIHNDMKRMFDDCHKQLLETLLHNLTQKRCHNRQLIAYCLDKLVDAAPQLFQDPIIKVFLESPYRIIRRRALNRLYENWDDRFEVQVASSWLKYYDPLSTRLIVEKFPSEFLLKHFDVLDENVEFHSTKAILYEHTYPASNDSLKRLFQRDGITYAYICAKTGRIFSEDEAHQLVDQYSDDQRIGILIWALGIMKHWKVLEGMYNRLSTTGKKPLDHLITVNQCA